MSHPNLTPPLSSTGQPQVVIIGAGFGGLACAEALGGTDVRVTVIDRRNYHLFVPLLYQVATAALSPADIAQPIRKILSRHRNIGVILGEVAGIDRTRRRVTVTDGGDVPYDRLVIATGSSYSYFGHDDWAAVAPGLKTIEDAQHIRARLLGCFERAELSTDPDEQAMLMTSVIVGGGPTGVELAGAIAELTRHTLVRDFRRIDPRAARILLVEAGPRLLTAFPEPLSDYAHRALERLGVTVLIGQTVERIEPAGVTIAGRFIPAGTMVWGAGVQASPASRWLGVETDRAGRIRVDPDLSVPGLEGVYALGDTALAAGDDGKPLPGLAQVAKQQGHHLGKALAANLGQGTAMPPFRFRNRGNTAIVGRSAAVFDFGNHQLKGWFAWLLWAIVHVYLLAGFEKRLLVSLQWLWRYLTYERGARLIIGDDPVAHPGVPPVSVGKQQGRGDGPGDTADDRKTIDIRWSPQNRDGAGGGLLAEGAGARVTAGRPMESGDFPMPNPKETLIDWLRDAYAMESQAIEMLERQVERIKNYPELLAKAQEHIQVSNRQAERLQQCLKRLGTDTSSIKTGIAMLVGNAQSLSGLLASDEIVKASVFNYAFEHFEIANYRALIAAAEAVGETDIARVLLQSLDEEMEMATWLEQRLPQLTRTYLSRQEAGSVAEAKR